MKRVSVITLRSALCGPLAAMLVASCGSDSTRDATSDGSTSGANTDTDTSRADSDASSEPTAGSSTSPISPSGGTSNSSTLEPSDGGSNTSTTQTNGSTQTGDAPAETTNVDASDSTSEPDETSEPPADAYVPCSGSELPALDLQPVLLPPKLNDAIHLVIPPGQPGMFYVVERDGAFKRFDMTQEDPTATTLVTLSGVSTTGEMGFLSAALHPNFDGENEKRAYLLYTPAQSFVLQEYTIEGDMAVAGDVVFEFTGDTESNHNGGLALFGRDGYLYVGIGDGGGGNDQHGENGNGQNTNTHYGKLLRLDVDAPDEPVPGNLTSEDVEGEMVDGRILHYGLRNPWRFAFDRLTNDLYIGDVGQNAWEEVDYLPADAGPTNFGWAAREGFSECGACGATVFGLPATEPIYDYENPPGNQESRSITGGYVYRGNTIPGLYGRYLFADYQTAVFYVLTANGAEPACDVIVDAVDQNQIRQQGIVSFAEDVDGELYVVSLNDGIFKIVAKE